MFFNYLFGFVTECWKISEVLPSCSHLGCDKEEHPSTGDDLGNQIMVGIEAMQHANSTFEDFVSNFVFIYSNKLKRILE